MAEKEYSIKVNQGNINANKIGRVKQFFHSPEPPLKQRQSDKPPRQTNHNIPKFVWIPALVFTSLLIVFMIIVFFVSSQMTDDQRNVFHLLFCLLAGFSTLFLGGTVLLQLNIPADNKAKMAISATAGVAIFIFTYICPPFWYKGNQPAIQKEDVTTSAKNADTSSSVGK